MRALISSQLKSLPEPEYVYEVSLPGGGADLEEDEGAGAGPGAGGEWVEDAADVIERQRQARAKIAHDAEMRKSSVSACAVIMFPPVVKFHLHIILSHPTPSHPT